MSESGAEAEPETKKLTVTAIIEMFKKALCKNDKAKCPSESSLKTYAYSILWLSKRMDFPADGSFPKPEQVMEYMENAKVSHMRRCSVYTALKKYHGCMDDGECAKYCTCLVRAKRAVDANYMKQERTKRQEKNWIEFPVLKKFAYSLRDDVFKYDKNAFWSKVQFTKAQLAFILLFHLRYPIRRELSTVQWDPKRTEWEKTDNYIDFKEHVVVLQKHKTSKYTGTHKLKLTRNLWRLWGLLKKQQNRRKIYKGHILLNKYYRPMSPSGFTTWLKNEMRLCEGCEKKGISCMIIRHCCITHRRRHEMSLYQKRQFAHDCLHSEGRNELYRTPSAATKGSNTVVKDDGGS